MAYPTTPAGNAPSDNYIISRNTSEADRLAVQHDMMLSCQGYYLHPDITSTLPSRGARIADMCTGTAIFLREIAPVLLECECHGFDISDTMYPPPSDLPGNISLHVADMRQPFEQRWLQYFDVLHLRFIEAAMKKDDWGVVLKNLITLLKPGGWIQWVEDDRAHSVRHAARPVAPLGAAKQSLVPGQSYVPPRLEYLDRFNAYLMPNARADDMTFGYMNLDALMRDASVGNLENVGCDVYPIDRQDDGGKLRRDWAAMGIAAVRSMLTAKREAGDDSIKVGDEELTEGFLRDMDKGGYYVTRASVFTGRKRT